VREVILFLRFRLSLILSAFCLFITLGCAGGGTPSSAPDTTNPEDQGTVLDTAANTDTGTTPIVQPTEEVEAFIAELTLAKEEISGLTVEGFIEKHTISGAYVTELSFDPMASTFMSLVDEVLELDAIEKEAVSQQGFVISGRLRYGAYGPAYLDFYKNDLPLLVTTDSVLHALHRSFDTMLMQLETNFLSARLDVLLSEIHNKWQPLEGDEDLVNAAKDVDVYISVARTLLGGVDVSTQGSDNQAEADRLLDLIEQEQFVTSAIFDRPRKMDFSQMKPRGHYTQSEELTRYFKAMMWLGRVDFRPVDQSQEDLSQTLEFVRRQFLAAVYMSELLDATEAKSAWTDMNDLIRAMIGRRDSMGPPEMSSFLDLYSMGSVQDAAQGDPDALMDRLLTSGLGAQRIRSHWIETNPHSTEMAALPVSYLVLGQRFTVDSHVFSNVVYDSIEYEGQKVQRVLPWPLDAIFALGNDAVAPLLKDELEKYPYHQSLALMRWYTDGYDEEFWGESLYNTWLSALRGMNPSNQDFGALPETLRTEQWQRKVIHTQLTSWAELRHDTLLYAKQSYTGGVACEYPAVYVEPYPLVYGRIAAFAQNFADRLEQIPGDNGLTWMISHLKRTNELMIQLQIIAQKELDHEEFTDEEVEFLKTLIDADPGCGDPVYSGWYKDLYFMSDDISKEDQIIADVHTNPNQGPLPGPNVLHVGTGDVFALILTIDTCDGPMTFVGPVQGYHEVDVPEIKRLTDEEWQEQYKAEAPEHPWFEAGLWVHAPIAAKP
jgi:hypothetical protein